jgi:hypothetical protein
MAPHMHLLHGNLKEHGVFFFVASLFGLYSLCSILFYGVYSLLFRWMNFPRLS